MHSTKYLIRLFFVHSRVCTHRQLKLLQNALARRQRSRAVHHSELDRSLHRPGCRPKPLRHRITSFPPRPISTAAAAQYGPRALAEEHVFHLLPIVRGEVVHWGCKRYTRMVWGMTHVSNTDSGAERATAVVDTHKIGGFLSNRKVTLKKGDVSRGHVTLLMQYTA